jgi:tellurite methyltransferase
MGTEKAKKHDYEKEYSKSADYYWGVNPSSMCLKIISLLPPEKPLKLLDMACGEGKDAVFFARCGYEVSAFDITDSGVEKTQKLAAKAGVKVNVFKADICEYRLESPVDIIFSSGALHYIRPELRKEAFNNYQSFTNENGLNAFNVFISKPFIAPAPEKEAKSYLWDSGRLLTLYRDWLVEESSEYIFDCHSSGVPHQHAMNVMYARKPSK